MDVYQDSLDALPLLTGSYGVSEFYAINQGLDVWMWLARNGLIGKKITITCEGNSGELELHVPQQPEDTIQQIIDNLE